MGCQNYKQKKLSNENHINQIVIQSKPQVIVNSIPVVKKEESFSEDISEKVN